MDNQNGATTSQQGNLTVSSKPPFRKKRIIFFISFFIVLILATLLIPFPYYESRIIQCKLGGIDCKTRGWHLGPSLGMVLWQSLHPNFTSGLSVEESYTTIPSPTLTVVNKTANWKTYKNEEFGFKVRYPKKWSIQEISLENFGTVIEIRDSQSKSSFAITEGKNEEELSLDAWFRKTTTTDGRPTIKASAKSTTIDGVKAYRLNSGFKADDIFFEVYIANKDNRIFTLVAYGQESEESNLLDQILSTFRFVE